MSIRPVLLSLAFVVLTAGCAAAPAAAPAPVPSTPIVVERPSGPPKGPSDQIKKTSWVVGTVTRGGTGPCYGLVTDDGVEYALHSTAGTNLARGSRMRINTATAKFRISCGSGRPFEMIDAQPLR